MEADDMGVAKPAEGGYLTDEGGGGGGGGRAGGAPGIGEDLDGHAVARVEVARVVDLGGGTAAEDGAKLVLAKDDFGRGSEIVLHASLCDDLVAGGAKKRAAAAADVDAQLSEHAGIGLHNY